MERQLTAMIEHMATSQQEMAKILEAERLVTVHLAKIVQDIPSHKPSRADMEELTDNALSLTKNVAAYLTSLAEFADALGDHLAIVLRQVEIPDSGE